MAKSGDTAEDSSAEPVRPKRAYEKGKWANIKAMGLDPHDLEAFTAARKAFIEKYGHMDDADPFFYGSIGGDEKIRDLKAIDTIPPNSFGVEFRAKLQLFMKHCEIKSVQFDSAYIHRELSKFIDIHDPLPKKQVEKLATKYTIFRYYTPQSSATLTRYETGWALLRKENDGVLRYYSSSRPWAAKNGELMDIENVESENFGATFVQGKTLFFLGRQGLTFFRLAIAFLDDDFDKKGWLKGLVLSVREEGVQPYASRFVMIPSEQTENVAKYADSTRGEAEFSKLWHQVEIAPPHYILAERGG